MDFKEILQLAREFLSCPTCGNKFDEDKIKFRGFIDDKFIIQTECEKNHTPLNALFVSAIHNNDKPIFNNAPISSNDVLDVKLALSTFDGDFERIFKKESNHGKLPPQGKNS